MLPADADYLHLSIAAAPRLAAGARDASSAENTESK